MATRFLRYDSDPILRKKCKAVLKVYDKISQLLDDMLDTLHETENGAALAANQVGVLKRLVVIDFNDTRLKLVNPQMISQSGVQECVEGCLSFPNRFVKTIRPQKVTIQALNEYGEEIIVEGEDEMAKCFCHELEHLDGMIFLDKEGYIRLSIDEEMWKLYGRKGIDYPEEQYEKLSEQVEAALQKKAAIPDSAGKRCCD